MKILAFDTALTACSAAVAVAGRIVAGRSETRARGHAERIVPMIREVMDEAGIEIPALDLIAVTVGPGTFTGVRIGLAAARAMALPGATPVLGLGTLEAVAHGGSGDGRCKGPQLIALDARRGEVYCQLFSSQGHALGDAQALAPEMAAALAMKEPASPGRVSGSGAGLVLPHLPGWRDATAADDMDLAPSMTRLAAARAGQARAGAPPSPVYLRAPDARLPAAR